MKIYGSDVIGGVNVESFDTLPPWEVSRTGSMIYVVDEDMFFFATQIEWIPLPDANKLQDKYRLLGGTGHKGGSGATGLRGAIGPVGLSGGSGGSGYTGHTGGTGGVGFTGGSGGSGGTGGTSGSGGSGNTGRIGQCVYGLSGDTGGTGTHGLIGLMLGDGDSSTLLCMVEIELRGMSGDEVSVEFTNVYNSFDIPQTILAKSSMVNDLFLSADGKILSIWPDFFATHSIRTTMPNLTFNNSMKEVQVYTNQHFDIKLFHPLDGHYQDITGWLDHGHVIKIQVMYVAARKICEHTDYAYVDFIVEALGSSTDYPYVDNTTGFGGGGSTFDVKFTPQIPSALTYSNITFEFGTTNVIRLSDMSGSYTDVGVYDVTMNIVGGANGDVSLTKNELIHVVSGLDAGFDVEFLTDIIMEYPMRVKFIPDSLDGGEHEWFYDRINEPSSFITDASPIITYPEANKSYNVLHKLTIGDRTVSQYKNVTTTFNPLIDLTIELIEFDEWRQTVILRLTDITSPDNILSNWLWDIHEYDGQDLIYQGLQSKTVDFEYSLDIKTDYVVYVSFTAIGTDTNSYDSNMEQLSFSTPYIERGIVCGGSHGYYEYGTDEIWVINPLNASDVYLWASLNRPCRWNCGASNGNISDGLIIEGCSWEPNQLFIYDEIERYTIKSFAKTSEDFARLSNKTINSAACSNLTGDKIVIAGGTDDSGPNQYGVNLQLMERMIISTGADQMSFGILDVAKHSMTATSNGSANRAFFIGGYGDFAVQEVLLFSPETLGSFSTFLTLTTNLINACAISNSTNNRILVAGGQNVNPLSVAINTIQTFNANSASSVTNFGNLYIPKLNINGFSTGIGNQGFFIGGQSSIDYEEGGSEYWNQWSTDIETTNIVSGANTTLFGSLANSQGRGYSDSATMSNSI